MGSKVKKQKGKVLETPDTVYVGCFGFLPIAPLSKYFTIERLEKSGETKIVRL